MAKKVYPVDGVKYYTSDVINLNKSIIGAKTITNDGFKVTAKDTPSMKLNVASGYAIFNGYSFSSTATETITITKLRLFYSRLMDEEETKETIKESGFIIPILDELPDASSVPNGYVCILRSKI